MEGAVVLKGLGLLLFGGLFVWLGLDGWKHRREDRISLIEETILAAGGDQEPLPFNRWDRIMAYVQPILLLVFGPAMICLSLVILFA